MANCFSDAAPQRLSPWLRRSALWSLVLGAVVLGVGCAPPPSTPSSTGSSSTPETIAPEPVASPPTSEAPMVDARAQQLGVTAVTTLGGEEIFLEVAATPQQQALGLMYREPLPDDRGMLFPLGRARPVSFWMKNVPVPLDMVFIYNGAIAAIAADVPPCTADPCPTYGPEGQLVDQVIELRAGRAAELGLREGDEVVITPL
ncbi:DUF192 domain-containing protein [Nodosilinea sp. E11]|uniref:DUF192 domain-containing protein n=1 Tax=Nodosilinea sp. E11 TaxID=3037479 RepID=UPI0029341F0C|nr:DUF192 domain-containing protein [Nodosilinea sp. E11]WOD38396.1 DUF192 domain-containing protein [Nodosilinea sp. E11]